MNHQRRRIDLGGIWEARLGAYSLGPRWVPASYPPVGTLILSRDLPALALAPNEYPVLVFEGIANAAAVRLDGRPLGSMVAFSRHVFELPRAVAPGGNRLEVEIQDLGADLGNTRGWETYGGIIRDVYLEVRPLRHLEDIHLRVDFSRTPVSLESIVQARRGPPDGAPLRVTLSLQDRTGRIVAETEAPLAAGDTVRTALAVPVLNPHRWSPMDPYCYQADVGLWEDNDLVDALSATVGFREVRIRGRRFLVNGEPLFLQGVCRHDLWHDQGYTLTREQMRADMTAIKQLGANFVRLVHYPHHPFILELADELGLFVTEEPGFWNVRLDDERLTRAKVAALDVLRRTIVRDRNHPSLFAWLLGNESWADPTYLAKAERLCRGLDPSRFVGFSDVYTDVRAPLKEAYAGWNADFYDCHPYGDAANLYRRAPLRLDDKPLIFGEWGGFWIQHDDWLMDRIGEQFAAWAKAPDDAPSQVAGMAFWQWADMRQYHRGHPGCDRGVLTEGLVTEERRRKPEYERLRRVFEAIRDGHLRTLTPTAHVHAPLTAAFPLKALTVRLAGEDARQQETAWAAYAPHEAAWSPFPDAVTRGLPPFQTASGRPLILSPLSPTLELPVETTVRHLIVVGLGDLNEGFPVMHRFEDPALSLTLFGPTGTTTVCLRHGVHVARLNRLYQGSRIQPLAVDTEAWFDWVVDPDYDVRIVRVWRWPLPEPMTVDRLRWEHLDGVSAIVVQAVWMDDGTVFGRARDAAAADAAGKGGYDEYPTD